MNKILIIGGAGYVGSVVTAHFLKLDFKVNVLDQFVYDNQFSASSYVGDTNYKLFKGDFGDYNILDKCSKGVDQVFLLGGLVGDPITKNFPKESGFINEKQIIRCIDYFDNKNIEKLVFISTCSNYGLIKEDELADEKFKLNPLSLYAKAKVNAEKYLLSKKNKVNYSAVVLRFATAFGLSPRMRFDLTISEFTRDLFFNKELVVFDEHTWRPYCHIRDFARLLEIVYNSEKSKVHFEIFNAGGDKNNFTKKMILNCITKNLNQCKIVFNQNDSDPRNYRVSFKKVKDVLGFEPAFNVEKGVEELIDALQMGLYSDSLINKDRYGNYNINYSIEN
tara:strand:- start:1667 stop:2671 length:1005 start_codon:yes stop_codon:yes gene_type:complete